MWIPNSKNFHFSKTLHPRSFLKAMPARCRQLYQPTRIVNFWGQQRNGKQQLVPTTGQIILIFKAIALQIANPQFLKMPGSLRASCKIRVLGNQSSSSPKTCIVVPTCKDQSVCQSILRAIHINLYQCQPRKFNSLLNIIPNNRASRRLSFATFFRCLARKHCLSTWGMITSNFKREIRLPSWLKSYAIPPMSYLP